MKIFLDSYGCALNQADAAIIRGILEKGGHTFSKLDEADVVILNSCSVKNATENRMCSRIEHFLEQGKKVIVTGCLPAVNPARLRRYNVVCVSTDSLADLPRAVKSALSTSFSGDKHSNKLLLPHSFAKEAEAVPVEICEGCAGRCAYCGTKNAR
ncbi:MAG: hypothetical protein V1911_02670, partial [Candidatus Micrarchaeota archaeon]